MIQNSVIKNNRITVIDALRGFALLGVILVHMQQHYSIFNFGAFEPSEPLFPILDTWVTWLTRNVLMGRFINIFAFLFGMSFFIQMDRAAKKGIDFRRRFIWRMVILFLIGIIGSAFYSGDILSFTTGSKSKQEVNPEAKNKHAPANIFVLVFIFIIFYMLKSYIYTKRYS